jgi:hypothetical protein
VRELPSQKERGNALARLHHIGGTLGGRDTDNEVNMVWLDSKGQDIPPTLTTLLLNQDTAPLTDWSYQHRPASSWAPDEVVDDKVDSVFIMAVLLCLFHGLCIAYSRPHAKG